MHNKNSIIEVIEHPYSELLYQARYDEAVVTGQPMVERPFWFRNTETGQLFHDLYSCLGWPTEVTDKDEGMPGYTAVVGVVRPDESMEQYNPINADFQLLAEAEARDVQVLIAHALQMRERYGFGLDSELLKCCYGDPERFIMTLALRNEQLGEKQALTITPPIDLYSPSVFDNYLRSLKSCLLKNQLRFYFGGCNILKDHLREFRKNNPAVMAIGGLVHSLLVQCSWMTELGQGIFNLEENYG